MIEIVEKLVRLLKSDAEHQFKLPLALGLFGAIVILVAKELPTNDGFKDGVALCGAFLVLSGALRAFFIIMEGLIGVNLFKSLSDGAVGAAISTLLVGIFVFGRTDSPQEDNSFIYRVLILFPFTVLYGGLAGIFAALLEKFSAKDLTKNLSIIILVKASTLAILAYLVIPHIPEVPANPLRILEVLIFFILFSPIFALVNGGKSSIRGAGVFFKLYVPTSLLFSFILYIVSIELFIWSNSEETTGSIIFLKLYIGSPRMYLFFSICAVIYAYAVVWAAVAVRINNGAPLPRPSDGGNLPNE